MPWKRAKALPPPDNALFDACFRIQREAGEAAGHRIPMVVENVKGAQPWVGRAAWHYGSYFLWGQVPAIMPFTSVRKTGRNFHLYEKTGIPSAAFNGGTHEAKVQVAEQLKGVTGSWFGPAEHRGDPREASHYSLRSESIKQHGSGQAWFDNGFTKFPSRSARRKAASAQIAKIPFPLARWIARCYRPAG